MSLRFGGKDFTISVDALSLGKVSPGSSDCVGSESSSFSCSIFQSAEDVADEGTLVFG